jgi:hypothetical protein
MRKAGIQEKIEMKTFLISCLPHSKTILVNEADDHARVPALNGACVDVIPVVMKRGCRRDFKIAVPL